MREQPLVTLQPANGRIWVAGGPSPLATGADDVPIVLCTPASNVHHDVRPPISCAALDPTGNRLAIVSARGGVYNFHLRANRYTRLDREGSPSTCAAFSNWGDNTLFVGFKDATVRAYDVVRSVPLGILREHRTAILHISVRSCAAQVLTTSIDSIVLWDGKALHRKCMLGGGRHGALQANFTADEEHAVAAFQDGMFCVWRVSSAALVRSFSLPPSAGLPALHKTFAISPDGMTLVAAGLHLPVLLVFNLLSGSLLRGLLLPDSHEVLGATQLAFLADSTTLVTLMSDGSVRFIDIAAAAVVAQIPYRFPNRKDSCRFSLDAFAKRLTLLADGQVLLYDLPAARAAPHRRVALTVLPPDDMAKTVTQILLPGQGRAARALPLGEANRQPRTSVPAAPPGAKAPKPVGPRVVMSSAPGGDDDALADQENMGAPQQPTFIPIRSNAAGTAFVIPADATQPARRGAASGRGTGKKGTAMQLSRPKLAGLLDRFGEYPAKYRLAIWDFMLRLPHNKLAFRALVDKGTHPCAAGLPKRFPSLSKPLATRLAHVMSQLAHWCPVFGEAGFMPSLVFPFVALHLRAGTPASSEACFETLATLLTYWTRGWFERFPQPPVGVLARLEALLAFHDPQLAAHLRGTHPGGAAALAWRPMQDLASSLLPQSDWLKLWDHCISSGPDYFYFFMAAYFMANRAQLLELHSGEGLAQAVAKPLRADLNKILRTAYHIRLDTPAEVRPLPADDWQPMPVTGAYTPFTEYPPGAVELFAQERRRIEEAEDGLARRRRVVSELAARTTALQLSNESLTQERAALAALAEQRREQLRQLEAMMLEQARRLEDREKEERLKQVALQERAQQQAVADLRAQWRAELVGLRREVAERQRAVSGEVAAAAEAEAIAQLEFAARQKAAAMEREAAQAAAAAKLRDEAKAHAAELEALQRSRTAAWRAEERQRDLAAQHEAERQRRMVAAAEEAAAQAALRREMLGSRLAVEEQLAQVEAERKLRALAEEQATLTRRAAETKERTAKAQAEAQATALNLQAQLDARWFTAQQQRRIQMLADHQTALAEQERHAAAVLADTEQRLQAAGGQSAVLQRREQLEALNADQDAKAQQLLAAMEAERARAARLAAELQQQEESLAAVTAAALQLPSDPGLAPSTAGPSTAYPLPTRLEPPLPTAAHQVTRGLRDEAAVQAGRRMQRTESRAAPSFSGTPGSSAASSHSSRSGSEYGGALHNVSLPDMPAAALSVLSALTEGLDQAAAQAPPAAPPSVLLPSMLPLPRPRSLPSRASFGSRHPPPPADTQPTALPAEAPPSQAAAAALMSHPVAIARRSAPGRVLRSPAAPSGHAHPLSRLGSGLSSSAASSVLEEAGAAVQPARGRSSAASSPAASRAATALDDVGAVAGAGAGAAVQRPSGGGSQLSRRTAASASSKSSSQRRNPGPGPSQISGPTAEPVAPRHAVSDAPRDEALLPSPVASRVQAGGGEEQLGPASPMSTTSGEVSDIDALLDRLRRDLDLTETEDEAVMSGSLQFGAGASTGSGGVGATTPGGGDTSSSQAQEQPGPRDAPWAQALRDLATTLRPAAGYEGAAQEQRP